MGSVHRISCKKCGYNISINDGIGFLFPVVYRETVTKMKNGEFGSQAKAFFEKHPDGAINCESTLIQCKECGEYFEAYDLSMHVPKPENQILDYESDEDSYLQMDYVMPSELEEEYDLFEKFSHHCPKCSGEAEVVENFLEKLENGELKCSCCGGELEGETNKIMWD